MNLIYYNSFNNSSRHKIRLQYAELFKNSSLIKNLKLNILRKVGRATDTGKITIRHKGNKLSSIFKKKNNFVQQNQINMILGFIYNPKNSNFLTINFDLLKKTFFYRSALYSTYTGTILSCQYKCSKLYLGDTTNILNVPVGSKISNIILKNNNITMAKAAGTYAILVQKRNNLYMIKVPSGLSIYIKKSTYVTLGLNSNVKHKYQVFGKAGYTRLKGIRPTVRGVAMNPVDHPHGGKTKGGFNPVSPWGKRAK